MPRDTVLVPSMCDRPRRGRLQLPNWNGVCRAAEWHGRETGHNNGAWWDPELASLLYHGCSIAGKHRGLTRGRGQVSLAQPLGETRGVFALGKRAPGEGTQTISCNTGTLPPNFRSLIEQGRL